MAHGGVAHFAASAGPLSRLWPVRSWTEKKLPYGGFFFILGTATEFFPKP